MQRRLRRGEALPVKYRSRVLAAAGSAIGLELLDGAEGYHHSAIAINQVDLCKIPVPTVEQLESAMAVADARAMMARWELNRIAWALRDHGPLDVVALAQAGNRILIDGHALKPVDAALDRLYKDGENERLFELIERRGAVSAEVALAMASGACRVFGADVGLALTGIAGPSGGTLDKPVGYPFDWLRTGLATQRISSLGLHHQWKNPYR